MIIDLHRTYLDSGMIVVPHVIDHERVARLRVICEHVLSQWRVCDPENGVPGIEQPDAFVMRNLNHPAYYEGRREWLVEMLETIADPHILEIVGEVFNDEVLFRCTSLFMNPLEHSSDGNWHRDSQFVVKSEDEERQMFDAEVEKIRTADRVSSMQLQIALVPSEDNQYVPGSHLTWDTPDQRFIRLADGQKHNRSNLMPDAVGAHLEPGDMAAFHPFGLHRGRYHADKGRRSLMLTYTAMSAPPMQDQFSDQPWFLEPGYLDGVSPGARAFFERFIEVYRDYWRRQRS